MFFKYRYIPNYLSLLRIILTPIFIFTILQNTLVFKIISLSIFFIASLSDFLDGYIARKYNFITNFGKNIDPLSDKILIVASFIVLSILFPNEVTFWMVFLIIFRDIAVTLLRYYRLNTSSPLKTSFLAKRKTLVQIIIIHFILILNVYDTSYILNNSYIYYLMWLLVILTWYSAIPYFVNRK